MDTTLKLLSSEYICHVLGCPAVTPSYLGIDLPEYASWGEIGPAIGAELCQMTLFSALWQSMSHYMACAELIECSFGRRPPPCHCDGGVDV